MVLFIEVNFTHFGFKYTKVMIVFYLLKSIALSYLFYNILFLLIIKK